MDGWKKDRKAHLEKLAKLKNYIPSPVFKYQDVQQYRDEFDKNPMERTEPTHKDKPRIAKKSKGKSSPKKEVFLLSQRKKDLII